VRFFLSSFKTVFFSQVFFLLLSFKTGFFFFCSQVSVWGHQKIFPPRAPLCHATPLIPRAFIYIVLISAQLTGQIVLLIFRTDHYECFHAHLIRKYFVTKSCVQNKFFINASMLMKIHNQFLIIIQILIIVNKFYIDLNIL